MGFEWVPNDSAHDWTIAFSGKSTKPNAFNNNQTILGAYDYQSAAWWGQGTTNVRPTVHFTGSALNDGNLYTNQAFIQWMVDNSDYWSRYNGGSWTNPAVVYNSNTGAVGWSLNENNVTSTLYVQFSTTPDVQNSWETVSTLSPCPSTGSYAFSTVGSYRLKWTYVLNGVNNSYTSSSFSYTGPLTPPDGTPPVLVSFSEGYTANARYYVNIIYQTPQPSSVVLQYWDGSYWDTIGNLMYDVGSGSWNFNDFVREGQKRILATSSDGGILVTPLSVEEPSDEPSFGVFGDMAEYVEDFFSHVGSLFSFLPSELSVFLVSAIMAMVILGIVQLVKP